MTIKTEIHQLQCKLTLLPKGRWQLVLPDGKKKTKAFFPSLLNEILHGWHEPRAVEKLLAVLDSAYAGTNGFEALFKGEKPSIACVEIDELAARGIALSADGRLAVHSITAADNPLNPCHSLSDALDMVDALAGGDDDQKRFLRDLGRVVGRFIKDGELDSLGGGSPHLAEVQAYLAAQ